MQGPFTRLASSLLFQRWPHIPLIVPACQCRWRVCVRWLSATGVCALSLFSPPPMGP